MVETQLNIFDAVVIGIMLLSCLFAFFRGFVREVLSLGAWIGAALVTLYFFESIGQTLRPYFKSPTVATGVGTLGIYICALIGFSIINSILLKFLKSGSDVGVLDNLFGLFFGFFRGAFIISLGFFLIMQVIGDREPPVWLAQSKTRPYVAESTAILVRAAPEYLKDISSFQKGAQEKAQNYKDDSDNTSHDGYSRDSTQQLERMIQTFGKPNDR